MSKDCKADEIQKIPSKALQSFDIEGIFWISSALQSFDIEGIFWFSQLYNLLTLKVSSDLVSFKILIPSMSKDCKADEIQKIPSMSKDCKAY
jgi:hypothetical protein